MNALEFDSLLHSLIENCDFDANPFEVARAWLSISTGMFSLLMKLIL